MSELLYLSLIGLIFSLAAAWLTVLLLLEKVDAFEGPFKSQNNIIHFPEKTEGDITYPVHYQAVAAQDYVRRFFHVYDIRSSTWTVDYKQAEVWMCPKCLITWLTVPFSLTLLFIAGIDYLIFYPVIHLAMCSMAKVIYERL